MDINFAYYFIDRTTRNFIVKNTKKKIDYSNLNQWVYNHIITKEHCFVKGFYFLQKTNNNANIYDKIIKNINSSGIKVKNGTDQVINNEGYAHTVEMSSLISEVFNQFYKLTTDIDYPKYTSHPDDSINFIFFITHLSYVPMLKCLKHIGTKIKPELNIHLVVNPSKANEELLGCATHTWDVRKHAKMWLTA